MSADLGIEIERKFLVRDVAVLDGLTGIRYQQCYLSTDPERTVRVRRAGDHAYVTIKGRSVGAARPEFEYPIPLTDVDDLMGMCDGPIIEKTRYRITIAGLTWEVDIFAGANAGLVVAEVEIPSIETLVTLPPWIGDEVTDDPRYLNSNLVGHPFREWQR